MNDHSHIPAERRLACTERMLTKLVKCGETNLERKPIYKCKGCGRVTIVEGSSCYPLSQDIKRKKQRRVKERLLADGTKESDAYAKATFKEATVSSENQY